jgi:hypothetical protein
LTEEALNLSSLAFSTLPLGIQPASLHPSQQALSSEVPTSSPHDTSLPFAASQPSSFQDVPAGVWYEPATTEVVSKGWMNSSSGLFRPADPVIAKDATDALRALSINISSLDTLPSNPNTILTKGQFLQIATDAFRPQLQATLKRKTQAEYTRAWNAIPASVSHAKAARLAVLAGWIEMPKGSFHGSAPLNRAEMAKIIVNVLGTGKE